MSNEKLKPGIESRMLTIVRVVDTVSWVVLFIMMVMTMIDVVLRYCFNLSVLGSMELTELMMVIVLFCSLAQCQAEEGHIKVDLVLKRFHPRVQTAIDVVTQFICFILFSFMAWSMYHYAVDMKEWGEVTLDLRIVKYPFVYIACFGSGLLAIVLLFKAIAAFKEVVES